ncbi:acetate/propionate family kinase [Mucilaginibacter aquariorum]|uniref:Acetate kinase n=1 Tax=Mucilaginibacter aquariorum TaxID=2967225 RepID=A0ABT1T3K9_9SPHI|nr:acetate kinase [Mucilaginibacter aquariorum]MCQ6959189.1 acetate kinase [Mucilaginibacter aquariorum]
MNIFVINSGSSSIKYQLFQTPLSQPVCSGLIERIGLPDAVITHKTYTGGTEQVTKISANIATHEEGMLETGRLLTAPGTGVLQNPDEIDIVGHRIVHGGETLTQTTVITPRVKDEIKKLFPLAPLHNPGHLKGIEVAEKIFKRATQIAVFDTAFHQTMPEKAFRYAVPDVFYKNYGIRVYGFHGISHKYVAGQAMKYLKKPDAKLITIHLGNGCSMAAIKAGVCVETSMGLTPLDGLIMGTRCGNIDASVLLYLMTEQGYTAERLTELLNKQSGMFGLTGQSDMRYIRKMLDEGSEAAKLAYEMYAYRIRKYIGSYAAALEGLDAIVFTAGVGENDSLVRELVCKDMRYFGISIEETKNRQPAGGFLDISAVESGTKVLVIPTNEELEIADQCLALINNKAGAPFN